MTDKDRISVSRHIDASAKDIFEVLTLPSNHVKIDGSGFVRSDNHADRIQKTGTKFVMNMEGDHMDGEYQTDNWVSAYAENQMIGWKTAPAGQEPPGWEWLWELKADGADATEVTLTYDWSKVTDQKLRDKLHFPLVPEEDLEASLGNLASVVSS